MLPHVFVGCSSEAAQHVAPVIQLKLARTAMVQIWNQGLFSPGTYVLDVLSERADGFDFAILIFAADDVVESRGKSYVAVRDNTVLEAGFFLAHLGRLRTFIMAPSMEGLKLPSDFDGLTRVPYPKEMSPDLILSELEPACYTLRTRIQELGKRERPEARMSDGAIVVLALLAAAPNTPLVTVRKVVAHFNGDADDAHLGWEKATQYLVLNLSQLGLVEFATAGVSVTSLQLTRKGRVNAQDAEFKAALRRVLTSPRGAGLTEFFPTS